MRVDILYWCRRSTYYIPGPCWVCSSPSQVKGRMAGYKGQCYRDGMGSPEIPALALIFVSSSRGSLTVHLTSTIHHELFLSQGLREYGYITKVFPMYESYHSGSNEFEAMDPAICHRWKDKLKALYPAPFLLHMESIASPPCLRRNNAFFSSSLFSF